MSLAHLPDNKELVEALWLLADMKEETQELSLHVYQSYLLLFPQSRHFPNFLYAFGMFHLNRQHYELVDEKYGQALQTFLEHATPWYIVVNFLA
ncbi:MAG: hypothetical protein J0651_03115, partial [Actinobacteria bacterium]|nr:hypothetical protein [Actinomycetota bacterium]